MRQTTLIIFLFFAAFINAQVKFEKGYIITNDGEKKEVLIKNIDWINSPNEFTYKINENSKETIATATNVKEFAVYNYNKYVVYNGPMDYSSEDISLLSYQSEPEFKESTIFLKEITSGNKNLYSYKGNNMTRYFYSETIKDSDIKPLTYKKYYLAGNNMKIATNEQYISELKKLFSDDPKIQSSISTAKYTVSNLKKLFIAYNGKSLDIVTLDNTVLSDKNKTKFNLSIRPGVNFYSKVDVQNMLGTQSFESRTNFRIGIEAEVVLPFNRNKWAVLFEPTYSFYSNGKISQSASDKLYNISMDSYSFINLPIGIRHYMFLNEKSKFFINAQLNVLRLKSGKAKSIDLDYNGSVFDNPRLASSQVGKSFSIGAGYTYNNKYTVELQYNTSNEIIENSLSRSAKISYSSIILGYNIF
ncbi:porin family protein [Chryseobacterium polytrichastri]|uniref:Outer membrane protein beta-barrel domain-containing protein n=1 Tax=Chryseobacterium polytrichastri TaxID=1302687 RepID=A0A1M6U852_9FLAO|nr:hypothetical protein [Chryseobacterium polytrichastri]SHK65354.1 hypothetical protein SAMN05444267_100677 [Chryseobacterium polytrichastri]